MTEPLIHYYSERRKLLTVDGMMSIEQVTRTMRLLGVTSLEELGPRHVTQLQRWTRRAVPGSGESQ